MNAIESMSGGENLIGLRGRGVSNVRPFYSSRKSTKKVELMLKEKEDVLKRDLAETEDKLKELKDSNTIEKQH